MRALRRLMAAAAAAVEVHVAKPLQRLLQHRIRQHTSAYVAAAAAVVVLLLEYYLSQCSSMQCGVSHVSNETIPIVYCRERESGGNRKADEQVKLLVH